MGEFRKKTAWGALTTRGPPAPPHPRACRHPRGPAHSPVEHLRTAWGHHRLCPVWEPMAGHPLPLTNIIIRCRPSHSTPPFRHWRCCTPLRSRAGKGGGQHKLLLLLCVCGVLHAACLGR